MSLLVPPGFRSPQKNNKAAPTQDVFKASLAQDLPYEEIFNGIMLYRDGSVGTCYILDPIYMDSLSEQRIVQIEKALGNMINALPQGYGMQFLWRKNKNTPILEKHIAQIQGGDPLIGVMTEDRVAYWKNMIQEEKIFGVSCEVWIRKGYPRSINKPFNTFVTGVSNAQALRTFLKEQKQIEKDFLSNCERITSPLKDATSFRRASDEEMYESIWRHLFGSEKIKRYTNKDPLRGSFGGCDFSLSWGYITLGNTDTRNISICAMHDVPESSFMVMINFLLTLPQNMTVVMNIRPVPLGRAKERLRRSLKRYTAFTTIHNPESEKRANEIYLLLSELESSTSQLFDSELYVISEGTTLADLERKTAEVIDAGRNMDMVIKQEKAALRQCFAASLPGQCWTGLTDRGQWIKTENVVNFMPVLGPIPSASRPVMLMRGPYKTVFGYDPFDSRLPAPHALVFGSTGAGKSFTTSLLILSFLSQGPLTFIVDKGGSYKKLTEMVGGSYFDFGGEKQISLNPLEGKDHWQDRTTSLGLMFQEIFREPGAPGVSRDEMTLIDRMIRGIYTFFHNRNIEREPTLSDVHQYISKVALYSDQERTALAPLQQKMARHLSRWTRIGGGGLHANLLDNPESNVSMENSFVAFDLLGIDKDPDLMNVVFLTINDLIMRKVTKDRQRPKIVVFDEVWSLLSTQQGAKFLEEMYRTMRKYQCMVLSISQDVEDFSNSVVSNAIMSNTYQQFILRQTSGAGADKVREVLKLTDNERNLIDGLRQEKGRFSEILLKIVGVGEAKMAIIPSPIEYWLATTDPVDRQVMDNYLKQGYTLEETLNRLAKKYPHGASYTSMS